MGRVHDWFFAPQPATDLAATRIVVFGLLFLFYLTSDLAGWADVGTEAWLPIGLFRVTGVGVLPTPWLGVLAAAWKLGLLLVCVGLFTRVSAWFVAVAGFYLLALPHNFGKVDHFDALLVFVFFIVALSRAGDAWSLDARWSRRPLAAPSGEYRWPIRCVWLVMAVIFFSAGYSKLAASGLEWVTSDHMETVLIKQQYNSDPLTRWGAWIARQPVLPQLLAGMTLIIELGYPLALVSRRARWLFVPGMFFAQLGIRVLMGPAFWPFLICNAFWVPWGQLLRTVSKNRSSFLARSDQV